MQLTRRFVFRGNASALSGQVFLPRNLIVDLEGGASSLGVSGGISRSQIGGTAFGDVISFGSAMTHAEGRFDEEALAREVVSHKRRQDELTTTTTVTAEVRELRVSQKPVMTIKRIRGTLVSRRPDGSGEPSIAPGRDTTVQGIDVGGYGLAVNLNVGLFQKYDTRSKLLAAADNPSFVKSSARFLSMDTTVEGQTAAGTTRLISRYGVIYATIVSEIKWIDKPYPKSSIDGNSVSIPNLGRVYFGELLISAFERRMTMIRFELGSYAGGYADGVDVACNGSWYP
jgi:hypothetical protein